MKNVLLTIAYDGTDFCGWQKQPGQRSVQGEVERALSKICARPIQINGTSRTDAGVHAYGQRANFKAEFSIPTEKIPMVANGIFAAAASGKSRKTSGDVAILEAEEMPPEFHARFNAIGKKYRYKISNSPKPDPFERNYCYQIAKPLDTEAMKQAAVNLIGTQDFKCFQAAGGKELESTVRTIYSACLAQSENFIGFEIIGDGFLYNMVRIIVGTLIDIGLGKKSPEDLPVIIGGKDRRRAGHTAPPQGLYLAEVYYEEEKLQKAIQR
jgi:tRNA pseudouridine38-40 synthase